MAVQTSDGVDRRHIAASFAPVIIIALAGMAARTPLATAYPFAALLLFLWVVADTLMLSLIARSAGKPAWSAVLGVLAGASFTVWLGSPSAMRDELLKTPVLAVTMAAVIVGHVAWATARAHEVSGATGMDRKERLMLTASELFPPTLVRLAIAEITVIHMALFRWGGPPDVPANARAFAYHKHLTPMCATLLILSAIEIAVYHLLVGHWSRTATLVMFALSDVGFVYLFGLIKSFRFRPVLLTPEGVRVRAGFLIDEFVPLDAIVAIDGGFTGEEVRDPATLNAALLAWPNIMLQLDRPLHRRSLLRKRSPFVRVAFRLDNPEPFIRLLAWRLGQHPNSAASLM
jgi:hypothetical protein